MSADVDIQANFADGAGGAVVSWQNWFQDIDASSLRLSIAWLAEQGITIGCSTYRFCPTANVTRAQMAMFLDRAFDLPSATIDYFDDDDGKTGEASINALAKAGITGGCGPSRVLPDRQRDPRPDGDVPRPRRRAAAAAGNDRLLRR